MGKRVKPCRENVNIVNGVFCASPDSARRGCLWWGKSSPTRRPWPPCTAAASGPPRPTRPGSARPPWHPYRKNKEMKAGRRMRQRSIFLLSHYRSDFITQDYCKNVSCEFGRIDWSIFTQFCKLHGKSGVSVFYISPEGCRSVTCLGGYC